MYAHIIQNTGKEFPESTEMATWTSASLLPGKLSVVGLVVCWHLHISGHFGGWSMYGRSWLVKTVYWTKEHQLHRNFTEESHLQIKQVDYEAVSDKGLHETDRGGRMHETKETSSDQTRTIQERMCHHQWKQHTRCIAFGESVLRTLIQNDFQFTDVNKIKASECHRVLVL